MTSDPIPRASGVYKITCTTTAKIYIGSAVSLRYRRNAHFSDLRRNKHCNRYLQNAWAKHGEQAFTFEVLELVLPMSLTAREQYWINKLKPFGKNGFNMAYDTVAPTLGRKASPEQIEKMSRAMRGREKSPEHREKLRQSHLGMKSSPEAIEKYRQAMRGKKQSPEHVEKRIAPHRGREKSPAYREKIRQGLLGKKQTPEHVENARQTRIGKKLSPESLDKRRQGMIDRGTRSGKQGTP